MKFSTGRSSPRHRGLALVLLAALALPGCVTRGRHQSDLAERESEIARLERELQSRDRSIEALRGERDGLLQEIEGLRAERESLAANTADLEETLAERNRRISELRGTYDGLVSDLETELAAGQIQIEQLREGIRLNLSQQILFPLGSAEVSSEGLGLLETVAGRVDDGSHRIEVRGHTDDLKIHGSLAQRYPTNWELAGARAAVVARALQGAGVPPTFLSAVSYGEYRPAASNETAEGRSTNRRIEIWLRPVAGWIHSGASPGAPAAGEGESAPE
jgi:chemotaxis protein MotB